MSRSDREENQSVALYWDFENLHASLSEARLGEGSYGKPDGRFKPQEPLIVGGDSDFMPVSQKIKAAGRTLIDIGNRKSTNRHWAKSCHEFRYYKNLVEIPAAAPAPQPHLRTPELMPEPLDPAAEIFKRAIRLLTETKGDSWVNKRSTWRMIKRLDPTFDTKDHGYANSPAMVKAHDALIEVRKGDSDQVTRLR